MTFTPDDYAALVAALTTLQTDPDDPDAEATIARLQRTWIQGPAAFWLVVQDGLVRLWAGQRYYPSRGDWFAAPPGGRPRHDGLETAWQLARLEQLVPLGREPTGAEIAAYLLQQPDLRLIADIRGVISMQSLIRAHQRDRTRR